MPHAGEIHRVPPGRAPGDDDKPNRPYLLLHDAPVEMGTATLAYGTTQPTLRDGGCACVRVDPQVHDGMGLAAPTEFCLCRLFPFAPGVLTAKLGALPPAEMDRARTALRTALGIGRGTALGAAAGSWRGAFVRLAPFSRAATGARFALVVTDPDYSVRRWHQHLVPLFDLFDGSGAEGEPGSVDVEAPWLSRLDPAMSRGFLAVSLLFSGSETGRPARPGHFSQLTGVIADEATMERVDAELVQRFGLS